MKNHQLLVHLSLALAVVALGIAVACHWWGPGSKVVEKNGVIHHPKYGTYPKVVPFEQGMTIMPGQSAIMPFEIIIEKEKEDKGI